MPKKGKGGKNRRKGKKGPAEARALTLKEEGQEYALVGKMLGDGRLTAECADGKDRIGIIRGAMRKRVWIAAGDYILIGLRDFQDDKADVIHKYAMDEVRRLKKMGEISDSMKSRTEAEEKSEDENLAFEFADI